MFHEFIYDMIQAYEVSRCLLQAAFKFAAVTLHEGSALVVWPGILFPTCRGYSRSGYGEDSHGDQPLCHR